MRLLHTSDWHLGRMIYGRSLLEDQTYFIDRVFLPLAEKVRPDCVVLSGDIYDRSVAPAEAIRLFDRVVTSLSALKIPLLAVSGNHDGAERLVLGAPLLRSCGIYLSARTGEVFEPASFSFGGETVRAYLLPWSEPAQARECLRRDDLHTFAESYEAILSRVRETLDPKCVNLLVTHCFAAGGQVSDSESPLFVGGGGEVPLSCFEGFDYVALGHLHAPQRVGEKGRYSGSPLKYSFDEECQKKGISLVTVKKGVLDAENLPVSPLHEMRTLSGSMEELLAGEQTEDYVYLRVTDPCPVYLPAERLRPRYPNLLGLHCDWMDLSASGDVGTLRETLREGRTDEKAVFGEFLRQVCGVEPTEADLSFFASLLDREKEEEP